ncbi:hypothetical protein RM844_17360 [Streptomyces sp. DSM 44915]|uniref:Uncharacterized protein n=1 Tax=Streptomyces chisholmiae TaxID=3075540 RepID=A0ABU2JST9_9ACTN|nr:hypothetical protein [Streptomyces sp. DSM 44915]MDT0268052.1 hypothetical protein [Streptomyces sp. DSM 44915]
MDLRQTVASFRNCAPLADATDAWVWSPAPGLHFSGALSPAGDTLFQLSYRGEYREEIARAVAVFSREHAAELASPERPLTPVAGFAAPGFAFDTLAALPPAVHQHYEYENPELNPFVYEVFPGYACEFAGDENEAETQARRRLISPSTLDREPVPYLKMRFRNTRTGVHSQGTQRGLAPLAILHQELAGLMDAPGSFVEFENRHHEVWRAAFDDTLTLDEKPTTLADAHSFADEVLLHR